LRDNDFITAFYIPRDLKWFELFGNGQSFGVFNGNHHEIDIELLLQQSFTIPQSDPNYLEYILWRHRNGKRGRGHSQESEITIDGQVYKRVMFVQPFLNMVSCPFTNIEAKLSEDRPFYIETSIADTATRDLLCEDPGVYWVEDESRSSPLCIIWSGCLAPIQYKQNQNDNCMQDNLITYDPEILKDKYDTINVIDKDFDIMTDF
jgi:hypothetical protein